MKSQNSNCALVDGTCRDRGWLAGTIKMTSSSKIPDTADRGGQFFCLKSPWKTHQIPLFWSLNPCCIQ